MSITVSPLSQTVSEGGIATFTATASGIRTREFEYEWFKFKREKSTIVVGRNRNLIINNISVEDVGSYYSCVTNEWNNRKCSLAVTLIISGKLEDNIYMTGLRIAAFHTHNSKTDFSLSNDNCTH